MDIKVAKNMLKSYSGMTHKLSDNAGRPKLDQAIETVLQELENSISKDKVREVLEKYRYTNVDDIDSLLNFYQDLKKLLEDK